MDFPLLGDIKKIKKAISAMHSQFAILMDQTVPRFFSMGLKPTPRKNLRNMRQKSPFNGDESRISWPVFDMFVPHTSPGLAVIYWPYSLGNYHIFVGELSIIAASPSLFGSRSQSLAIQMAWPKQLETGSSKLISRSLIRSLEFLVTTNVWSDHPIISKVVLESIHSMIWCLAS